MISPALFASMPFGNLTAYRDLFGSLGLYYDALIPAVIKKTALQVNRYPISAEARQEDLLQAIQSQHQSLTVALGIAAPPDLASYDLRSPEEWASFTWIVSQDLTRIRNAAGVL